MLTETPLRSVTTLRNIYLVLSLTTKYNNDARLASRACMTSIIQSPEAQFTIDTNEHLW
jgi:hypothetical protein